MTRPLSFSLRPHRNSVSATPSSPSTPASTDSPVTAEPKLAPRVAGQKKGGDANHIIAASRQEVRNRTRNDWDYPLPEGLPALRVEDDTLYVPRSADPMTPSPSPQQGPYAQKDPYRYQDPDSVGESLEERRKRKRLEEAEELEANEGLRIFEARRDAWTGTKRLKVRGRAHAVQWTHKDILAHEAGVLNAHQLPKVDELNLNSSSTTPPGSPPGQHCTTSPSHLIPAMPALSELSLAPPASDSAPPTPSTHTATTLAAHTPSLSPSTSPPHSPTPGPSSLGKDALEAHPDEHDDREPNSDSDSDSSTTPYTPLPAPLLPSTHPTRALITPAAYPSIYSRVVVQGTAPRLPIPLGDLVAACVQGWKSEGEWPPKGPAGGLDPLAGRRKKTHTGLREGLRGGEGPGTALMGGVGSLKRRVLRIVHGARGHAEEQQQQGGEEGGGEGEKVGQLIGDGDGMVK